MAAIEVDDLWKSYGGDPVLRGLTMVVGEGTVYGLLGRNGAGKSTLLHVLLGLLRPRRGTVRVLGKAPGEALARIGYLPERARYHTQFTPFEYLMTLGRVSGLSGRSLPVRCREAIDLVGLTPDADRRLGAFSKGMLQRFGIAQSLLADPDLLFIDEPTSGLDPAGQIEVLEILDRVRRRGHAIFMCTHQIAEAERLCDTVGVLSEGKLAAESRVADLASSGARIVVRAESVPDEVVFALRRVVSNVAIYGREIRLRADEPGQQAALRAVLDAGLAVSEFGPLVGGIQALYQKALAGVAERASASGLERRAEEQP